MVRHLLTGMMGGEEKGWSERKNSKNIATDLVERLINLMRG